MATIYRTASRVIAWLGQASTDQTELLLWLGGSNGDIATREAPKADRSDDQHCNNGLQRNELLEQHHWEAFRQLCWKTYWTRLWMVQEVVLAKAVTIICGGRIHILAALGGFYNLDIRADDNQELLGGRRKATSALVQNILGLSRLYHRGRDTSFRLGEAAMAFAGQICRDFHDHVYGVLGLVEGGSDFHVDYSESAWNLCTRVLEHDATRQELSSIYIDNVLSSCNTLMRALNVDELSAIPITVAFTYTKQEPVGILMPAQIEMSAGPSLTRRPHNISYEVWLICKTAFLISSYLNEHPLPTKEGGDNKGLGKLDEYPEYAEHSPDSDSVPCMHELQWGGRDYAIFSLFNRTTACTYRWTGGPDARIRTQDRLSHDWNIRGRRADDGKRIPVPRRHNTNTASAGQDQPAPYIMLLPRFEDDPSRPYRIDPYTRYISTGILPFREGDPCFYPRCKMRLILLHDRTRPRRMSKCPPLPGRKQTCRQIQQHAHSQAVLG